MCLFYHIVDSQLETVWKYSYCFTAEYRHGNKYIHSEP